MNNDLTRQVLQKIREYMAAEKMSLSEFGRQTGVSKAWLSKLKHTDANLSLNTAQDLLHYMGYTLKLTREGGFAITPSRIKRYATRLSNEKIACNGNCGETNTNNTKDQATVMMEKEADVTTGVTGTTTTMSVTAPPAPINPPATTTNVNNGQPVKLSPGQTITVSASATTVNKTDEDNNAIDNVKTCDGSEDSSMNQMIKDSIDQIYKSVRAASSDADQQQQIKRTASLQSTDVSAEENNEESFLQDDFSLLYDQDFFSNTKAKAQQRSQSYLHS